MALEFIDFIRMLPLHSHSMLICDDREEKLWRLLNFIYFALIRGYAVVYLAPHDEIKRSERLMRAFGIKVPWYEERQQLQVLSSKEFYINDCKADKEKIAQALAELTEKAEAREFKGVYEAGDMSCFFENGKVDQLVEYELSLGREPSLNLAALCIYNVSQISTLKIPFKIDLIRAHGNIVFSSNVIKSTHPESRERQRLALSLLERA